MTTTKDPDMLDEYDFSKGVRGKYAERYARETNIVRLDDDVAAMFPNSKKVNDAPRAVEKSSNPRVVDLHAGRTKDPADAEALENLEGAETSAD
uniref:Uncharacterized protein n=1 Tax=Candidatus Kentrum eta TaxID=2126337 RepID=A0A450UEN1_9GAMM|nr:MAG: hypothetical protein BECKH772A_GA0070896_1001824 [Candidatus Kentron sp. H]VFJ90934.1 MAG: hypothetical protein BECKH772B_GA0070898_1001228 [Candidatus Kentron sp. H]VFJ97954.1 MAG: hypothetical protein BECKH772C_GA0070978_1001724 [Candidatus Kentron sp. H]